MKMILKMKPIIAIEYLVQQVNNNNVNHTLLC